jgi:hypothetical protein
LLATLATVVAACSSAPAPAHRTFAEAAQLENSCVTSLKSYLIDLSATRMDAFFGAALNGLLKCEAASGLAHVPTQEVTRWLSDAHGRATRSAIPKAPRELAVLPTTDDARLPYQRVCVSYMRRYLPASTARAGDDPDVAAAITFNALEECDSDSGFTTISPSDLAAIMQAKHLL